MKPFGWERKLKAEALQKIQLTHFILPHTLPIYSLDIVLYISAENPLGHCGSTSVPLEHIKAYLK